MKLLKIFLILLIFVSFILVGSPILYNCLELNLITIVFGIVFFIYKKFVKKEKSVIEKIDIIILLFFISPVISLIFDTYVSLNDTIVLLVKNISLFNIYLVLNNITDNNKNEFFLKTLIAGGAFLALVGIEGLSSNLQVKIYKFLNIPNIFNIENRMYSTLGYANSFAILMSVMMFVSLEKCSKKNEIYSGFVWLFCSTLLLSYSRSVLIFSIILFLIYVIIVNKKEKIYKLYVFLINGVLSLIYLKIFNEFLAKELYYFLWCFTALFFCISILIIKAISKKYDIIMKIKMKTYVIIAGIGLLIVLMVYFVGLLFDKPLTIFFSQNETSEVKYKVSNIIPNTKYVFTFDIDAKSKLENKENYIIRVEEENKYLDTIQVHEIKINSYKGKKQIEFVSSNETVEIAITFNTAYAKFQEGLKINSLKINDEKYVLDYVYLPVNLVKRIESISLNQKSLWERTVFWKDGLKIIKNNPLFGFGGNGWKYNYESVQSYVYSTSEVHSHFLQIWIDSGIVGIVLYIIINIYVVCCLIIKLKNKNINLIDFAFILLVLHSIIDFDMSFYVIMVVWVVLLNITTLNKNNVKFDKLIYLIIFINILAICMGIYTYKFENIDIYSFFEQSGNESINEISEYKKREKYKLNFEIYNYINYENLSDENLNYIYNNFKNFKIVTNTEINIARTQALMKIILEIQEPKKFCELVINENEEMIENIKNKEKNRLSDDIIEIYLSMQEQLLNIALEKIN